MVLKHTLLQKTYKMALEAASNINLNISINRSLQKGSLRIINSLISKMTFHLINDQRLLLQLDRIDEKTKKEAIQWTTMMQLKFEEQKQKAITGSRGTKK